MAFGYQTIQLAIICDHLNTEQVKVCNSDKFTI